MISERLKRDIYTADYNNSYFWRTTQQQEINYIEEKDGILYAYEFKWNKNKKAQLNRTFSTNYPNSHFTVVNSENYFDFVLSNQKP